MEKDIGKLKKNDETEIILRIDDFGGKRGLTIREFVRGERYTGFTKSGTRISADQFEAFKAMVNEIKPEDLKDEEEKKPEPSQSQNAPVSSQEDAGVDESGYM